jgi:hypothetical protein
MLTAMARLDRLDSLCGLRTRRGEAVLRVGKDRPGSVTPHCGPFRKVSRVIEEHPGQLTKTQAAKKVSGRNEYVLDALDLLVSEEYLKTGPERYPLYTSTKMYREKDDPQSDKYFDLGDLLRPAKEDTQTEEAAEDD